MNATIAYFTNRKNPRWAWFCDSLCRQMSATERAAVQVVVVDAALWGVRPAAADAYLRRWGKFPLADSGWHNWARREELAQAVRGRFAYLHIPPKPSVWQGPFRYTKQDWFAAANARNTAIIVAERPYLVCVDDLSVLGPAWVDNVRHAVEHGYVVCGAYKKLRAMEVEDGVLLNFQENPAGVDSRWRQGSDHGVVPWSGGGLFGCSFGLPVELAVTVDGFDAWCDGQGAEDYDFGIRVERAGGRFFYNRNMLTWESEEGHGEDQSLPRESRLVAEERLPESLRVEHPAGLMSDHVMLQSVHRETKRFRPRGRETPHGLMDLRAQWQRERLVPISTVCPDDWRTGRPLTDLRPENGAPPVTEEEAVTL